MQRQFVRLGLIGLVCILCYACFQTFIKAFKFNDDAFAINSGKLKADSLDNLGNGDNGIIDKNLLDKLRKEWDEQLEIVKPAQTNNPCQMSAACPRPNAQFGFRMRSGAASVIGPWVCVNGVDIMRSSLNNVDRGMNVAVVDGRTGQLIDKGVFDLYGKDSTDLINFIKNVVLPRETAIVLATSYDDAAMRLSQEARDLFKKLQFDNVDDLKFRDNFVFVGGVHAKQSFEKIVHHDLNDDKYGDWPASIEVEGCIDKI